MISDNPIKNPEPTLLIESQIFPPIQTIAYCLKSNSILIEGKENYQKRSFRNRYHIGSHQGLIELSVPLLKGKNNQQLITEVKISYDSAWPDIHWKAIQSSYGKAAYFIYYKDLVQEVLFSECIHLFELNMLTWKFVQQVLQQEWNILFTKEYQAQYGEEVLDLRSKINFKTIGSIAMPEYYQVFSASTDFIPHLSILDLIFHLGPGAIGYLGGMTAADRQPTTDDRRPTADDR